MSWIQPLLTQYHEFIKSRTVVQENTGTEWIAISTPYLDMHNDAVELFAKNSNGKIELSDDGQTLRNLSLYGVEFNRIGKRNDLLESILLTYGIHLSGEDLAVEANEKDFAQKKLNLLNAISEINDLYVLSKPTVASVFKEDVKEYLEKHNLIYTPHFISKGSTGLEFTFDFQIAYRKKEIVIKTFNTLNKNNLVNFLFSWDDIRQTRTKLIGKEVMGLAVVNDENKEPKQDLIEALQSRGSNVLYWKRREEVNSLKLLQE
ncbi:DUF1828 domain-containing protein [Lacibacter sp. MH-610]|uniref:DUF1828 domain-containing protein n=1 Tax=Lacibacter sp. MH-610 TaxID=3020883 RepID=UPI0038926A8A